MARDQFITHSNLIYFAEERVNLKREDVKAYRAQVNNLREKLTLYINDHPDFKLIKMLHSGSVAKGTALKVINDMDVAVYISKDSAPVDEKGILEWMVQRLREVYGEGKKPEDFTIAHHCVSVKFHGTGLDVDVVPVIYEGGADDRGYLITKDTGDRVLTSIPLHLQFTRNRKVKFGQDYCQIIRFIKWWKKNQTDLRFKSFMAELIVAHLFETGILKQGNYIDAFETFLKYVVQSGLKNRIVFTDHYTPDKIKSSTNPIQIFDPVNPDNNVASQYTDAMRLSIVNAASESLDALMWARNATTKEEALKVYKEVFGPSFKIEA
jgi:tRNA nucleotidyltransferase (CCA-adding enzyme)